MKKLFLLFTVLCAAVAAQAQVISAYSFEATQGTYTEITEGIVMDTTGLRLESALTEKAWFPTGVVSETTTAAGFPIGFDFEFNDILCNQFVIGSHGYIALGRDEISLDPTHGAYVAIRDESADNIIGVMVNSWNGMWCLETTEISYKLIGEAPNRTLVVQFKDLGLGVGWSAEEVAKNNYQIRLNENGNTIEMVFGAFEYQEENSMYTRYALRGYYEDMVSLAEGEEPGMLNYYAAPGDNTAPYGTETVPGTTFTFAPPAACETPVEAIELTRFTPTSNLVTFEWNPLAEADRALFLLVKGEQLSQNPVDGVRYAEGDSIGNALVLTNTTDTIYEPWDLVLESATQYNLYMYSVNSFCTAGPKYSEAVCKTFSTKPAGPVAINITNTTIDAITFDVEANGTNNVMVIITDIVTPNPPYASIIDFGNPEGELHVGDPVEDKGLVVYMGGSATGIVVDELEPGTEYYLRAVSYDENYDYSSDYVQCADATIYTLPWNLDLSNTDLGNVPVGWESTGTSGYWDCSNKSGAYGDDDKQLYMIAYPNVEEGHIADLTTPQILVDKRDALFSFEYCMYIWGRFGNSTYDAWEANDKFVVQVSRNGGEFEDAVVLTAENNVKVDSVNQFIPIEVDLTNYMNDVIRIRIHWECFSGSQIRCPLEDFTMDGRPIPVIPEVSVSDITWNSANISWRGEQDSYEFAYAKAGEEFAARVVTEKSVVLTDLTHLTDYQVRVRGIVAEGDTTDWSEVVTFTTADLPECPLPEGLTHVTTEDFGDKLSWTINEEHLSWDLRYRESTATSWTEVEGLTTNEYLLYNLVPGASYLWRVRAHCDMGRVSIYASQEEFNANEKSAISAATADRLRVVAANGVITIYNSDVYVESVTLVDMNGRVLNNFVVNSRDNITIPTNVKGIAIVQVNTVDNNFVYKVSVK